MASKIKQTILAVAIAIVLALFVGFGINTFYHSPEFKDYCQKPEVRKLISTEEDCLAVGGQWTENPPCPDAHEKGCQAGWCDQDFKCRDSFDDARSFYNRNVFIVATIAGLIAMILGGVVLKLESVSSGIMGGGVLSILYGTIRYWADAPDVLRFVILGFVLATLIWLGYRKFGKS